VCTCMCVHVEVVTVIKKGGESYECSKRQGEKTQHAKNVGRMKTP
jgi:hypothetical protein